MAETGLTADPNAVDTPLMTVAMLREALASMPDEAMVLVTGYEGDMTAALSPDLVKVEAQPVNEDAWYYGEWRRLDDKGEGPARQAVYIGGERHDA